jgi:hypothetical protein
MIDVDDVLLLRPLASTTTFGPQPERPAPGAVVPASVVPAAVVLATICSLSGPADVAVVESALLPALTSTGAPPLAMFIEEPSENTFPALPVRTGEHVVVWIQSTPTTDATSGESPDTQIGISRELARDLLPDLVTAPVQLRLEPTPRSRLR